MINNLYDKIRLFFQKEKEPFLQLKEIMGFYPRDISLYRQAFMHRSLSNNNKTHENSNERLEFLGDAILSSIVSDIIFKKYTNKPEGFLTALRSKIVKRETLNAVAVQIGLDKFILHQGKTTTGHNSYMNGNAFEAFIGAIYLDRGYRKCKAFIENTVLGQCINLNDIANKEENYKSLIIEWCQKYQMQFLFNTSESKSEGKNIPVFFTELQIEGITVGKGKGYSKKESHQKASKQAYTKRLSDNAFINVIIDAKKKNRQQAKNNSEKNNSSNKQKGKDTTINNNKS